MKRGFTIRGLASAFALSGLLFVPSGLWWFNVPSPNTPAPPPLPPSLSVIQTMSELATTRVHLSDVITGKNHHWEGKWLLHGELILGVDLGKASYAQSNPEAKEAVLRLPPPHLISSKVDHDRSEELSMQSRSWMSFSSDPKLLRDEVWKKADGKLQRLAEEPGYGERAKVQAERVIQDLFGGVGWKVRFEWE